MAALNSAPEVPLASCSGRTSIASLFTTFHGLHRRGLPTFSASVSSIKSSQAHRRCFNISCCRAGLAAVPHPGGSRRLNVVFVSAEVAPWSKTGGLGDVIGGLPPALAALGHRVMTVAPRYDQYRDAWDTEVLVDVKVGDQIETVRYFHAYKKGVDRVFVDHPLFLEKVWGQTGSKVYGPEAGEDYLDNQIRFSLFNQAAIEAPLRLNLPCSSFSKGPYGEDVIFVANDWHSALVSLYLKANYKSKGVFKNAKVAMCIHNIAYQGRFSFDDFKLLNLPDQFKGSFDFMDGYLKPVKGRKINWMKAGLLESDQVLTVSPNYASELMSSAAKGVELDNIIRKTGIIGIVNGMDVHEWDPSMDKCITINYDATTVFEAKSILKGVLQAELGLSLDPEVPIFAFIGRLEEQKGFDILAKACEEILKNDVQLIALGTGKKVLQKQLEQLQLKFPRKATGIAKFSPAIAHMIVAGSDFMLVPSRFEPCGLIQLYAMRYGTIPVVATTGGLVDTVKDGETGFHVGRSFNVKCEKVDPTDVDALGFAVTRASKVYGTLQFNKMVQTSMALDWSWKEPAKKWEAILTTLTSQGSIDNRNEERVATRSA